MLCKIPAHILVTFQKLKLDDFPLTLLSILFVCTNIKCIEIKLLSSLFTMVRDCLELQPTEMDVLN